MILQIISYKLQVKEPLGTRLSILLKFIKKGEFSSKTHLFDVQYVVFPLSAGSHALVGIQYVNKFERLVKTSNFARHKTPTQLCIHHT
jgi:hypothetical protein